MTFSDYIQAYKDSFLEFDPSSFLSHFANLNSYHISNSQHYSLLAKSFFSNSPSALEDLPYILSNILNHLTSYQLISPILQLLYSLPVQQELHPVFI